MTAEEEVGVEAAVAAAAHSLYGLPASEFTAARDRHAAEARKAGDRELAAVIKKLRRPTASASLANRLVREHGDQVAELLGLGAAMREAQAQLAGDELRRLSQQGQQAVAALSQEARRLAGDTGPPLSEEVGRELEETLHAALADPAASDALRAGCLSTALHYSGFGWAGTSDPGVLGTVAPVRSVPRSPAPVRSVPRSPAPVRSVPRSPAPVRSVPRSPDRRQPAPRSPDRRQQEIEVARGAVRDAEARLAGAEADAADHERQVEEAREEQERLHEQIRQLNEQLERRRADEREAAARLRDAERGLRSATATVRTVATRLAEAQAELDRRSS